MKIATSHIHIELSKPDKDLKLKGVRLLFYPTLFCGSIFGIRTTAVAILNIFKSSL